MTGTVATKETAAVGRILAEDDRRIAERDAVFNPFTGEGSIGHCVHVHIDDYPGYADMWLPETMMGNTFMRRLVASGSIDKFIRRWMKKALGQGVPNSKLREKVLWQFLRLRIKHDFPFWAVTYVWIRPKRAGTLVRFWLNSPQRKLVEVLEEMRLAHLPIRIIVLKARQWGGSTCIQMYIAWLQLVHYKGASSAIEAHQNGAASNIQLMFRTMLSHYPVELLHDVGEDYDPREKRWTGDPNVRNIIHVPSREMSIQVGSAMNPESSRSFNVSFAHCSEVAVWPDTGERTPEKLVQAVCSGILPEEGTLVAYESTAKGEDNFFHDEYIAAKEAQERGTEHIFRSLFVAWFEIENYTRPFASEEARRDFALWLWKNRNRNDAPDARHEPGKYLWWLWNVKGASLEAINWYVFKRTEYADHASMANEFPSDDIEAFRHSGLNVFNIYDLEALAGGCRKAVMRGELQGASDRGAQSLEKLRFKADDNGGLEVWEEPEVFPDGRVTDRYLVTVDIGGRWAKADWSVICVIDRYWMAEGDKPVVVAQWTGHIDHDLLAWKAAQIAHWYDDAKLVIESNTLETKDPARDVDGDQSLFILDELKGVYDNLYAREQSADDIRDKKPVKYGFHTNTNTKPAIISNLIKMVRDNAYIERDSVCIAEMKTYQCNDGVYEAAPKHHDDRLMTRAIGLWICMRKMPLPVFVPTPQTHASDLRRHVANEATIG
ncbi:MAG: terminase [Bacteroidales bacterium]|nr:terminase [Bacteroidales bacterium]